MRRGVLKVTPGQVRRYLGLYFDYKPLRPRYRDAPHASSFLRDDTHTNEFPDSVIRLYSPVPEKESLEMVIGARNQLLNIRV